MKTITHEVQVTDTGTAGEGMTGELFMATERTGKKTKEFEARLARHYDELKLLYCELYENRMDAFEEL